MNQPLNPTFEQPAGTIPARPPNYLVRAIVLLIILAPLCILLGVGSLYSVWLILEAQSVRSEIPGWWRALMELLRAVVAFIGLVMPIVAVIRALKVNREYDAGNYSGAEKASKSAAKQCKQCVIYVFLIILIIVVDLLRFLANDKN